MYLTQVIGRMMIDQHHGHIINVASMAVDGHAEICGVCGDEVCSGRI